MNNLIVYFGYIYILIGIIYLFTPLLYLELGRSKDLIIAFLNLVLGFILIVKNKSIDQSFFLIIILLTVLVISYLVELFSFRWNQLTDKEKNKLSTFLEFKNNLYKLLEALNLGVRNFSKPTDSSNFDSNKKKIIPKKWVRNDKNDNIKT